MEVHAADGPAGGAVDTVLAVVAGCLFVVGCGKMFSSFFSRNAILAGTPSVQLVTASPTKAAYQIFGKSALFVFNNSIVYVGGGQP